jgi:Lysylphosphatidylglycerol synthase TM region
VIGAGRSGGRGLRALAPWIVSAVLLVYVFGYATDWSHLRQALSRANAPLFVAYAAADRLAFFFMWTWLSAAALRRFVVFVPLRSIFAIRGGSELLRAVSNPLSDGAFFLGMVRLAGGRMDAVLATALVPVVSHLFVMLVQMTCALPFLRGGLAANRGVVIAAVAMWGVVAAGAIGVALARRHKGRLPALEPIAAWFERFPLRSLAPFLGAFAGLAVFDVQIQWLASHAFGVPLDWTAIAARLPVVYLSFAIPTLGNFGTRELAWAALFSDFGSRDALVAYAFAVNAIFLVLNVLIGMAFLPRALELLAELRRARRQGEPVRLPILHDPTDQ